MRLFRSTSLATRAMVVAIGTMLWSVLAVTPAHAAPGELDTTPSETVHFSTLCIRV